jgi:hypothetical protein
MQIKRKKSLKKRKMLGLPSMFNNKGRKAKWIIKRFMIPLLIAQSFVA